MNDDLVTALRSDPKVREQMPALEAAASEGRVPPTVAARQLLELFLERHEDRDD